MTNRWWQYQRERFPVLTHGMLIAVFSYSALSISTLLRGHVVLPDASVGLAAFMSALIVFLHLRIADEFKDHGDDVRFRPHLPVPRGLVTLRELGWLAVIGACVQLALALSVKPELALVLMVVWLWLALMSKEFFVSEWLKARPLAYMASHMMIMPLIALYVSAFDWLRAGEAPPAGLAWFLAVCFFGGVVLEVGRKIRAPEEERPGVGTYSVAWGRRNATLVWFGAMVLASACALPVAHRIAFFGPMAAVMAVLVAGAFIVAVGFLTKPNPARAKLVEHASGVGILFLYMVLGPAPLLWHL